MPATIEPSGNTIKVNGNEVLLANSPGAADVWGIVEEDGTIRAGAGFSVVREDDGTYAISFNSPMDNANYIPSVIPEFTEGTIRVPMILASEVPTVNGFTVTFRQEGGATVLVNAFRFIIFGGKS